MYFDIEDFELAVADRFGNRWSRNAVPVSPATPRALAAILASRRAAARSDVSLTARAFFRIRRALGDEVGLEPSAILPGTRCGDLMPDLTLRRAQWSRFLVRLGIREAPRLVRSEALSWTLAIIGAVVTLAAAIGAAVFAPTSLIFPAMALAGGGAATVLLRLTRRWARMFPRRDITVGQLAHFAVAYGSPMLGDVVEPATTTQTLEVVQALVRLEIGAPLVDPDATWEELVLLARAS